MSGLKINKDKTEVLILGPITTQNIPSMCIPLVKECVKMLGVTIFKEIGETVKFNYKLVIEKMKSTIQRWGNRNLSLAGWVCILKTMVLSKLIYCANALPSPPLEIIKEIQTMIYKFIWKGGAGKELQEKC